MRIVPGSKVSRVLVAEDDRAVREALVRAFALEGYEVVVASDGTSAVERHRAEPADIILLDINMPGMDGMTVARRLRAGLDRTPVMLLTARSSVRDRVDGLDAGADDYMVKPFELSELMARVRALLRRSDNDSGVLASTLMVEDLKIETLARRVWRGDRELTLSRTEYDLIELLARHAGVVLDHATIYDRIWGYDFGPESKNLAVYIGYLRRKTEECGEARIVHTVRGVGYTLRS